MARLTKRFRWRSKGGVALLIGLMAALVIAALVIVLALRAGASPAPDPVAVSAPVALDVDAPEGTKIGVVITLGGGPTEGTQWDQAAQGAIVAQQRLALGGGAVELLVEDDLGTPNGAEEAVRSLIEEEVSGIVYASSGAHLAKAVETAAEAGLPIVLPYAPVAEDATAAWSLAPDESRTNDALTRALAGFEHPLLIDAGGGRPAGITIGDEIRFSSGIDKGAFAADVARRAGVDPRSGGAYEGSPKGDEESEPPVEDPADVVIVSGHPVLQASVVHELQSRNVSIPVLLTPDAVSPLFGATLDELGGSLSSNLRTVGAAWSDAEALSDTGQGRAMSAYLAAIRQFAGDETVTNLTADAPFAVSAAAADVRSHDAVIAFAEAAAAAGSTDPSKVGEALGELRLVAGDGIAGPELDFTLPQSLSSDVTPLYATGQQLGLRPHPGEQGNSLLWISDPDRP
ncbi:MAG: ABC transporter substrate-binding protein [Actinomycetota bacterium]